MSREIHVRFREGVGVRFPRATRLVMAFASEEDACRVMEVLGKRFARYGLTLHPEKTRMVNFRRPDRAEGPRGPSAGSFDMLGFTWFWGKSRQGNPVVKRKTSSSRFRRALGRIADWCRQHRHEPVAAQHFELGRKLQGHYAYYGITGNTLALSRFLHEVERVWRYWLNRRSARAKMVWERFRRLLQHYPLPPVRIVHSVYRFAASP